MTIGFAPLQDEEDGIQDAVLEIAGATVWAIKRVEKKIPTAALRDLVKEKVRGIEAEQGRRVYGRELRQLKDDIAFDLLPKMPAVSAVTYGLIDHETGRVVIDATTSRAEECLSLIRNAIGSLPVRTASVDTSPSRTMTHWLTERRLPAPFALGDEAVLRMPGESDTAKLTGCDLASEAVAQLLAEGRAVERLQVVTKGPVSVTLTDREWQLRSIQWPDADPDTIGETAAERFEADCHLWIPALRALVADVGHAFGGWVMQQNLTMEAA
jgi:recombination associated protein RdgC